MRERNSVVLPQAVSVAYMVNLASGPPRLLKTALGEVYHINLKGLPSLQVVAQLQ